MGSLISLVLFIMVVGSASFAEGLLESDYLKKFLLRMETVNNLNTELQSQLDTATNQLDAATNQLVVATNLNLQLQTDIEVSFIHSKRFSP